MAAGGWRVGGWFAPRGQRAEAKLETKPGPEPSCAPLLEALAGGGNFSDPCWSFPGAEGTGQPVVVSMPGLRE